MRTTTAEAKMRIRDTAKSNFCFNKDNAPRPRRSVPGCAASEKEEQSQRGTSLLTGLELVVDAGVDGLGQGCHRHAPSFSRDGGYGRFVAAG